MLPNWVSCCEVDGQGVFLDILANRYSRLGKTLGDALIRGELNDLRPDFREKIRSLGWLDKKPAAARSSNRPVVDAAREHSAQCYEGSGEMHMMASARVSAFSDKLRLAFVNLEDVATNVPSRKARSRESAT